MLYVFGVGEVPISISGDPGTPEILAHTIRTVGAVTRALVAFASRRESRGEGCVRIRLATLRGQGQDLLVVAGGDRVGNTATLACHALFHRNELGRISLVYGARSPSDLLSG
jgi:NAD(P)H-flavin reductase